MLRSFGSRPLVPSWFCQHAKPLPVVVYFHGGGWSFGSASGSDHIAAGICRSTACLVTSVDYRLAPENPYPAALNDCIHAVVWAKRNIVCHNGDPTRLYLAGDSAGGNLAAAVCVALSGKGIKGMILSYPALDLNASESGSMRRFATGYGLDASFFEKAVTCYISDSGMRNEKTVSPVNAELQTLPPALIISPQFDILSDSAAEFAHRLKHARYICLRGVTHAYLVSLSCVSEFQETMKETVKFIQTTSTRRK